MSKPLYEIAVLTKYSTKEKEELDEGFDKFHGLSVSCATLAEYHQDQDGSAWTQESLDIHQLMQQSRGLWSVDSAMTGVEFAQSVSGYSTLDSVSSWTGESTGSVWSSDGLSSSVGHSHESLTKDHDEMLDFDKIQFIPVKSIEDVTSIWEQYTPDQVNLPTSESSVFSGELETNQHREKPNVEQMLTRVSEDSCVIHISACSSLNSATSQRMSGSFLSSHSGQNTETLEYVTASDLSESGPYKTCLSRVGDTESSELSRSSSITTSHADLDETSSYGSEENLAVTKEDWYCGQMSENVQEYGNVTGSAHSEIQVSDEVSRIDTAVGKKPDPSAVVRLSSCSSDGDTDGRPTSSSSGYSDSTTDQTSSSSWDCEQSGLNPHSKPFYPKGYFSPSNLNHLNKFQTVTTPYTHLKQSNIPHNQVQSVFNSTGQLLSTLCDSGINSAPDLTHLLNSTQNTTRLANLTNTLNDSALPRATPIKYCKAFIETTAKEMYHDSISFSQFTIPKITEPVYDCKIPHKDEFTPIHLFSAQHLPQGCRSESNKEVILSLAQRVVRLCVRKPMNNDSDAKADGVSPTPSPDPDDPEFDHYGTGFVYHADKDYLAVRTHSRLVSSPEEAGKTRIDLMLTFPARIQSLNISCTGEQEGFSDTPHSQTVVFMCKTPPEMRQFLYLFQQVPLMSRNSFFNDSCYFTDSSPDTSATERDEKEGDTKSDTEIKTTNAINVEVENMTNDTECENGSNFLTQRPSHGSLGTVCHDTYQAPVPLQTLSDSENVKSCQENTPNKKENIVTESIDFNGLQPEERQKPSKKTDQQLVMTYSAVLMQGLKSDVDSFVDDNNNGTLGSLDEIVAEIDLQESFNQDLSADDVDLETTGALSPEEDLISDGCSTFTSNDPCTPTHGITCRSRTTDILSTPQQTDVSFPHFLNYSPDDLTPKRENPFSYCALEETQVRQAFETAIQSENMFSPATEYLDNQDERATPVNQITERRPLSNCLSISETGKPASPLLIMERNFDKKRSADQDLVCPYAGQNLFGGNGLYSIFTSYAGDIFTSCSQKIFQFKDQPDHQLWDYESLVYAQNHFREDYNRLYRPTPLWNIPTAVGKEHAGYDRSQNSSLTPSATERQGLKFCSSKAEFDHVSGSSMSESGQGQEDRNDVPSDRPGAVGSDKNTGWVSSASWPSSVEGTDEDEGNGDHVFRDFATNESYLATWDRDLLNLDDRLNPLPEMDYYENFVDQLVTSDEDVQTVNTNLPNSCCKTTVSDNRQSSDTLRKAPGDVHALIISFPHGGSKMISSGQFSHHYHVGGALYDTPTCMGSCGAPIIALHEEGGGPYATHYVHSGTIRVNNICTGMGVVYFNSLAITK